MKILIYMSGFLPGKKYGGPPVSVDNFCSLMTDHECFIVTKNHDKDDQKPYDGIHSGWNDMGRCKVLYLSDSEYKRKGFAKAIASVKPDLIYLQGLFQSCVLPCLELAKRNRIPILVAPRGELCAGALNIKKAKKVYYIKAVRACGLTKSIFWQSTSTEETQAIQQWMKADKEHIFELNNIPSIPRKTYPERKKVADEGKIVFLSRIHPKKNLLSALRFFQHASGKVKFDIYGPIEDAAYWEQCSTIIATLPENIVVKYKGLVTHEQVHEIFSQYDAFLFPTLSENYGHVIAESLLVGTPVIISDQTPWSDAQAYGAGFVSSLDNEQAFVHAIDSVISCTPDDYAAFRNAAHRYVSEKLNIKELKQSYQNALMTIMKKS